MLVSSVIIAAFAATGLAVVPEGYRTVYITSMVNPKFVVVPKARTSGSALVVFVLSSSLFLPYLIYVLVVSVVMSKASVAY
jgi:hypothetical protein